MSPYDGPIADGMLDYDYNIDEDELEDEEEVYDDEDNVHNDEPRMIIID